MLPSGAAGTCLALRQRVFLSRGQEEVRVPLVLACAKSLVTGLIDFGRSSGRVLGRSKLVGVVAGELCEIGRGSARDFFNV